MIQISNDATKKVNTSLNIVSASTKEYGYDSTISSRKFSGLSISSSGYIVNNIVKTLEHVDTSGYITEESDEIKYGIDTVYIDCGKDFDGTKDYNNSKINLDYLLNSVKINKFFNPIYSVSEGGELKIVCDLDESYEVDLNKGDSTPLIYIDNYSSDIENRILQDKIVNKVTSGNTISLIEPDEYTNSISLLDFENNIKDGITVRITVKYSYLEYKEEKALISSEDFTFVAFRRYTDKSGINSIDRCNFISFSKDKRICVECINGVIRAIPNDRKIAGVYGSPVNECIISNCEITYDNF